MLGFIPRVNIDDFHAPIFIRYLADSLKRAFSRTFAYVCVSIHRERDSTW